MARVRPLRGVRPRNDLAATLIAQPYDVPTEAEARALTAHNPHSFLHITRPEVDMPVGADAHAPEAYALAAKTFEAFQERGWLVQDPAPCFYLYTQTMGSHVQTALLALCSVAEYDGGVIKRHELTRPDKEQDRVDHIEALDAQTGLVFLTYRQDAAVASLLADAAEARVQWSVTTEDGVDHMLQVVTDAELNARISAAFDALPALYVADGHHRSAAASRVSAARGHQGEAAWFLAGIFPDSQLQCMAYNRLVRDLNGMDAAGLLAAIGETYDLTPNVGSTPTARGTLTMYLAGTWYGLRPRPGVVPADPVGALDVSVLQTRVLAPLLGIENPRTDARISFMGGVRGPGALQSAVDSGAAAVAFHMYPTGLDQLFAVADAGQLMPPKSTWFEPKLRGGVLVHKLDGAGR